MTIVVIVLAVALVGAVLTLWWTHRTDLVRQRMRRRVIVTRHDGTGFVGLLAAWDRRCVVLVDAQTEDDRGRMVLVDGEVLLLADQVAHMQFP
jgi:hypothetical protein